MACSGLHSHISPVECSGLSWFTLTADPDAGGGMGDWVALDQASSMVLGSVLGLEHRVTPGWHSLQGLGAKSKDTGSQ